MSYAASINSSLSELDIGSGPLEKRLRIINTKEDWMRESNSRQDSESIFVLKSHKAFYQGKPGR